MSKRKATEPKRDIPATRVAAFIQQYIDEHYETHHELNDYGINQFTFDTGIPQRTVYRILHGESANISFELVDEMLTRLDEMHLWFLGPEDGGFYDYYCDEPAPPAEQTIEQQRRNAISNAKRAARQTGSAWLDVLMDRARQEMELACA